MTQTSIIVHDRNPVSVVSQTESTKVIVRSPEAKSVVVPQKEVNTVKLQSNQPIAIATQVLRGERGATSVEVGGGLAISQDGLITINSFEFEQTANLALWQIQHNLGRKYPLVTVLDSSGETVNADINYQDINNLQIIFQQPTTGRAVLF